MLAGRDREEMVLDGGLGQLASGRGGVVLLAGEPGIGKSRLASELAVRAVERDVRVAWGRCWEAGGAPAFWPWHEALETLGVRAPDGVNIVASDPARARFALFREYAAELARAASSSPILILLEDLHAADQSTVLLLEFLAVQLRGSPVMVVGSYRELEARLRVEVGDGLARVGRAATVLVLARLSEPDVARVVRDSLENADDQFVARVFEATQGNPLFVTEIVQQVRAGGSMTTIPLGVREIIRQRLALVPPAARSVLEAGAVLGVELAAADLERLHPEAARELDAITNTGLVMRRGDRIRFAHSLYREALYHDLARPVRQALHREAARALSASGASPAEVAHHLLESGPDAVAEATEQALAAAHQSVNAFAFEDAIAVLERAKLAIPAGPNEAHLRTRLSIALGEVRIRANDPTGRELCVEGARLARELGDATLLALAGLAYGSVFSVGGVDPQMVTMLEDALASLPAGETGLRARTMARLAAARQPSPPALRQRDLDLAVAAVEMGRRVASRRELLEILQSASGALYGNADPRVRIQIQRQQVQLAEELGDAPRLIAAHVRLAFDHLELCDLTGYAEVADSYDRLVERFGVAAGPWRVPLMRSMLALSRDDFVESERWQSVGAKIAPDNPRARRARALHRICFLRAAERHAELRASIAELRSLWQAMPYGTMLADARVASTLARIGADDDVRALLDAMPDHVFEEEINFHPLAEAVWCAGDRDRAAQLFQRFRRYEGHAMAYWLDVEILEFATERSLAYLAGLAGDWAASERYFATALRVEQQIGRHATIARMKFELGDLFVRCQREPARARELLGEARAEAAAMGLVELVALIDRRHGEPRATTTAAAAQRTFTITREGEYYTIATERGTLRFKATRGFQYLELLVARAGADIHVLELVGSLEADRGDAGTLVDRQSLGAYRQRVDVLRDAIEAAEDRGDTEGAERARTELDALATELARGTRPGGTLKRSDSAVDRARSAVQRRLKDAIERIEDQDAELGGWLRRVVHTGNHCSFRGNA